MILSTFVIKNASTKTPVYYVSCYFFRSPDARVPDKPESIIGLCSKRLPVNFTDKKRGNDRRKNES
jgi:myo-inositol-1-phosphate synthase